jgi:thioredoxin 1
MASDKLVNVTEANFDTEVTQSDLPVLVDFWAPWCAPCMALMPAIDAITDMYAGQIKVAKINCDDAPALRERFGVRGIPHLMLMKDGEPAAVLRARTKTRLVIELDELLGATP